MFTAWLLLCAIKVTVSCSCSACRPQRCWCSQKSVGMSKGLVAGLTQGQGAHYKINQKSKVKSQKSKMSLLLPPVLKIQAEFFAVSVTGSVPVLKIIKEACSSASNKASVDMISYMYCVHTVTPRHVFFFLNHVPPCSSFTFRCNECSC